MKIASRTKSPFSLLTKSIFWHTLFLSYAWWTATLLVLKDHLLLLSHVYFLVVVWHIILPLLNCSALFCML